MIFNLDIKESLKSYAKNQVDNFDFGAGAEYRKGTMERQYTGVLAEAVICDLLGKPLPDGRDGYDGGCDFVNDNGMKFDVKCMRRRVDMQDHYKHNYYSAQMRHEADYFLFTNHNIKTDYIQVCGYLPGKLILKKGIYFAPGLKHYRDDNTDFTNKWAMFEFKQSDLFEFSGADLFKDEIERLAVQA